MPANQLEPDLQCQSTSKEKAPADLQQGLGEASQDTLHGLPAHALQQRLHLVQITENIDHAWYGTGRGAEGGGCHLYA